MTIKWEKRSKCLALIASVATILSLIVAVINLLFGDGLIKRPYDTSPIEVNTTSSQEEGAKASEYQGESSSSNDTSSHDETDTSNEASDLLLLDIINHYEPTDEAIDTLDISNLKIYTCVKTLSCNSKDSSKSVDLGVLPNNYDKIPITLYLIDYSKREIVLTEFSHLGKETTFFCNYKETIPDGLYFYIVQAEGYLCACSQRLFNLEWGSINEAPADGLTVCLESDVATYMPSFCVKADDYDGNYNYISLKTVPSDSNLTRCLSNEKSVRINDEGFLVDLSDSSILDFYIRSGYILEVKNSKGRFQPVVFDSLGEAHFSYY